MADGAVGIPNDEYNQLVAPVVRDRLDYFRQKLPELLAILREVRGPVFPINIIYEDQPTADFAPLIQTISAPKGTQRLPDNVVFAHIVPVSFYKQCTAPNTLNIIFCFWSAHVLSRFRLYERLKLARSGERSHQM